MCSKYARYCLPESNIFWFNAVLYLKNKKQGNFFHEIYFQKRLYFKTTCEIEKSKCDLNKKGMCINLKCSRWIELPSPIVKCFLLSEV